MIKSQNDKYGIMSVDLSCPSFTLNLGCSVVFESCLSLKVSSTWMIHVIHFLKKKMCKIRRRMKNIWLVFCEKQVVGMIKYFEFCNGEFPVY